LDPSSGVPLYKQLAISVADLVSRGTIQSGEKLPATRELAGQLGLNRTTVSAAYSVLEQSGLIQGHVGRGSFVVGDAKEQPASGIDWEALLPPRSASFAPSQRGIDISFANSRPDGDRFPLAAFRRLCKEVVDGPDAVDILQLGSPHGYPPLRQYLLTEASKAGMARSGDEVMITNGCQQALDLLARLFASNGQAVGVEDPVYHGLLRVFSGAGANLIPIPVDHAGMDIDALTEAIRREHPRVVLVTPSFQNPTGATLSLERRKRLVSLAQRFGIVLVENDIYSELRYRGNALPTLKELDENGNTILLRSYSKVSFPGLRVGWVIAPRPVVTHLAEAKQISDLHSDQLSQAVLLRFAESGELARHLERTRVAGAERLEAVLTACASYLPAGATFTRPEGGMSLWIDLPRPLTAEKLLERVQERGVDFLPGHHFSLRPAHARGLRISFGGVSPEQIARGIQILGRAAAEELAASANSARWEPAAALV
jgi:DNA-binding transcriptional MocR family regulator